MLACVSIYLSFAESFGETENRLLTDLGSELVCFVLFGCATARPRIGTNICCLYRAFSYPGERPVNPEGLAGWMILVLVGTIGSLWRASPTPKDGFPPGETYVADRWIGQGIAVSPEGLTHVRASGLR